MSFFCSPQCGCCDAQSYTPRLAQALAVCRIRSEVCCQQICIKERSSELKAELQAASRLLWCSSHVCHKPCAEPAKMNEKTPVRGKLLPNNVIMYY